MSNSGVVTIHTDGASRGNPGPAAFGYVIDGERTGRFEGKGRLPDTTNNIAEYTALVKALEHALDLGAISVSVFTDSELMVKQVQGIYKVKNENLKPLHRQILDLKKEFASFAIQHVPRKQNSLADKLCNQALDAGQKKSAPASGSKKKKSPRSDIREDAVMCLQQAAKVWALGDANHPKPDEVWDQLWSILQDGGVLR